MQLPPIFQIFRNNGYAYANMAYINVLTADSFSQRRPFLFDRHFGIKFFYKVALSKHVSLLNHALI